MEVTTDRPTVDDAPRHAAPSSSGGAPARRQRQPRPGRPPKGKHVRDRTARFRIATSTLEAIAAFGLTNIEILEGIERLMDAARTDSDAAYFAQLVRALLEPTVPIDRLVREIGVGWLDAAARQRE